MLYLTLKMGQSLRIGDEVRLWFEHDGPARRQLYPIIRVMVDAPKEIAVLRAELYPLAH